MRVALFDHNTYRREDVAKLLAKLEHKPVEHGEVWGNNPVKPNEYIPHKLVRDGAILIEAVNLVHSTNDCSEDLIDYIISVYPDSWIVEYSGQGIIEMLDVSPKAERHCIYRQPAGSARDFGTLKVFLDAVERRESDACNALNAFDPGLEARLEVLHSCLSRDAAAKALGGGLDDEMKAERGEFWNTPLGMLNPSLSKEAKYARFVTQVSWTVEDIVCALAKQPKPGKQLDFNSSFDPEYITALSALRDALLGD